MNLNNFTNKLPCDLIGHQRVLASHQAGRVKLATAGKNQLQIGTWNVRGLNQAGKLANICREMERLNIGVLGLSETFWKDNAEFITTLPNGREFRVITSGGDESRKGVAFVIEKQLWKNVVATHKKSERIISMIVTAQPKDYLILQVYAPTTAEKEEEIDQFYEDINETIKEQGGKKDRVIIIFLFIYLSTKPFNSHWQPL